MLSTINKFHKQVSDCGIFLCHWKSNATLGKALNADTDLDILVDIKRKSNLEEVFKEIGAVKFEAIPQKRYKNIDDWLCIDDESGKLIHFHTHYALDVGEKLIKSYKLPYAQEILQSRQKHPDHDFWVISPEWELLLLILRSALRIPPLYSYKIRNQLPKIGKDTAIEFEWLKNRISKNKLNKILRDHYHTELRECIQDIINKGILPSTIEKLNKSLRSSMQNCRNSNSIYVFGQLITRRILIRIKSILFKFSYIIPTKRTLPKCGIIVAFVGIDGSGKTTLTKKVSSVFSQKIDVANIYYGHGKSGKSYILHFFRIVSWMIGKILIIKKIRSKILPIIRAYGRIIDKRYKTEKIRKAINKGVIIFCDRFPQYDFENINDGPFFKKYNSTKKSNNGILRNLAIFEQRVYNDAMNLRPDILVKLEVSPQIAYKRNCDEIELDQLIVKSNLLSKTNFNTSKNIIIINNNKNNISQTQNNLINQIWSIIHSKYLINEE
jgi:hypothetical protein